MRILIWAIPFLPVAGGRELFAARLAAELVARGHEVLIVAPEHGDPTVDLADPVGGLRVVRAPVGALIDAHQLTGLDLPTDLAVARERVVEVLDEFAPQVVHAQALAPDLVLLGPLARARGVPVLVTDHSMGAMTSVAELEITQRVARIPDAVVAVSNALADGLVRLVPAVADRLSVIANGVPLPADVLPVDASSGRALYLGRLSPEKGVAVALTAWSVLARDRPDRELVVAGDGADRPALERLARHLGIDAQVRFTGWVSQPDIGALLDATSVVLVPSLWDEPFGLVAAEAAAHGRPVIASRVGGLPEIVVDRETGWLVDAGDILRLMGTLNGAFADPDRLGAMGAAARAHALASLGLDTCVDRYVELYRRLAGT